MEILGVFLPLARFAKVGVFTGMARFVGVGGEYFETRQAALQSFGEETPERIRKVRFAPKTGEIFD